jgi:UDP-N-acetylmuramate--alanine ligase
MCGSLMQGLGIPAQVLVGSAVAGFNGRSTLTLGNKYFIAETCEYRGHFLSFHPKHIVLTAVESDHQDFFPTYESIRDTFVEYCRLIPPGGELIYCADDPGASEVANVIKNDNKGVVTIPYGFTAPGDFNIRSYRVEGERALFAINAFSQEFCLRVPGRHQALNATAALALSAGFIAKEFSGWNEELRLAAKKTLEEFSGSKRRSEILGSAGGIIFMDDYGHHPTAIKTTLDGLRDFYPSRRLVVSFMSHTYSRTAALLDEFADSLNIADVLFLHKIYASAREEFDGKIGGENIYEKVKELRGGVAGLYYVDEPDDAFDLLKEILQPGDLFLTLGAGNNWPLGIKLFSHFVTGRN